MPPTLSIQTTTNQYLAPRWTDQVLRDNLFYAKIMRSPERWRGAQELHPKLYGVAKSNLIYGETPNLAFAWVDNAFEAHWQIQ